MHFSPLSYSVFARAYVDISNKDGSFSFRGSRVSEDVASPNSKQELGAATDFKRDKFGIIGDASASVKATVDKSSFSNLGPERGTFTISKEDVTNENLRSGWKVSSGVQTDFTFTFRPTSFMTFNYSGYLNWKSTAPVKEKSLGTFGIYNDRGQELFGRPLDVLNGKRTVFAGGQTAIRGQGPITIKFLCNNNTDGTNNSLFNGTIKWSVESERDNH
jgi:hypothetical protein